ncbi:MAG: hypothetical protein ACM34H_06145 [Deltaproteobacteria bacterium]
MKMRRLGYLHCILFAIIAVILVAGPAWTQPPADKAKVFKMNKKTGAVEKDEFAKLPTPEQLKEIRRALGLAENQDPGADDIIFYHSPNPGTCYWVGYWRCY